MDEIILEKIWKDETFYEIRLRVMTEKVSVTHHMYVNCGELPMLSNKINEYLELKKEFIWTDSQDAEISSLILNFKKIDVLGNVKIYITIKDEDYKCKICLNTYLGNIVNFSNKLINFDKCEIGSKLLLSQL